MTPANPLGNGFQSVGQIIIYQVRQMYTTYNTNVNLSYHFHGERSKLNVVHTHIY